MKSVVPVFNWGFECNIKHRRLVAVLGMQLCSICCMRSGVTWCTLFMALNLCRMCQCGYTHIGILMHLLAAEPRSTAGLLFPLCIHVEQSCWPCIRWCRTGGFQEQGQSLFIALSCSLYFCLLLLSLYLLSVYRLVLWGWCLRTHMA